MSRSVSYPASAEQVVFAHIECEDSDDFECEIENLVANLEAKFPSLYKDEKWIGCEDHALLANNYCRIGVSEYCGLVAVWIITRDYDEKVGFALNWVNGIAKSFEKVVNSTFGETLAPIARASNGEVFYQRVSHA